MDKSEKQSLVVVNNSLASFQNVDMKIKALHAGDFCWNNRLCFKWLLMPFAAQTQTTTFSLSLQLCLQKPTFCLERWNSVWRLVLLVTGSLFLSQLVIAIRLLKLPRSSCWCAVRAAIAHPPASQHFGREIPSIEESFANFQSNFLRIDPWNNFFSNAFRKNDHCRWIGSCHRSYSSWQILMIACFFGVDIVEGWWSPNLQIQEWTTIKATDLRLYIFVLEEIYGSVQIQVGYEKFINFDSLILNYMQ